MTTSSNDSGAQAASDFAVGYLGYRSASKGRAYDRRSEKLSRAQQRRAFARGQEAIKGEIAPRLDYLFNRSEQELRKGYDAALKESAGLQSTGARDILDRGEQGKSSIAQNVTDRGLSGTGASAVAGRGLELDVQRQLSDNAARFATLRTGIQRDQAQDLADHFSLRWQAEAASVWDPWFELMTGYDGLGLGKGKGGKKGGKKHESGNFWRKAGDFVQDLF